MVRQHAKAAVAVSPTCQHQRGNPVDHYQGGQDQWPDPPAVGALLWHRPGEIMCGPAQTCPACLLIVRRICTDSLDADASNSARGVDCVCRV